MNASGNREAAPVVQVSNLKYSYDQMQRDLEALKQLYPDRIQTNTLAVTADGRDVTEVILGDPHASHHILIQASIHAREYMNTVLAMNQIEDYLRYYDQKSYEGCLWSELYRDVCIHVIPMANPDGVTVSQEGVEGIDNTELQNILLDCYEQDHIQGKSVSDRDMYFKTWKANALGVDLNRNFDAGWDEYTGSGYPSADSYKGDSPASEQETKAILSVAEKDDLDCCISYHSYGNLIYWNYGSEGIPLEADQELAECVGKVTGYELHSTIQDSADSAGCSDYFVLKLGIPAVTIENGGSECPMPIEEYQPIYEKNQNLWPALAYLYGR
ncbi:MAG: M14 family zinc carboxypeptidase [Eubacteriales bacterium]|nr:M14 family zinc carboxypeptidase [Eubacteriales bacterium]